MLDIHISKIIVHPISSKFSEKKYCFVVLLYCVYPYMLLLLLLPLHRIDCSFVSKKLGTKIVFGYHNSDFLSFFLFLSLLSVSYLSIAHQIQYNRAWISVVINRKLISNSCCLWARKEHSLFFPKFERIFLLQLKLLTVFYLWANCDIIAIIIIASYGKGIVPIMLIIMEKREQEKESEWDMDRKEIFKVQ